MHYSHRSAGKSSLSSPPPHHQLLAFSYSSNLHWPNPYKVVLLLVQGQSLCDSSGSFATRFLPGCSELQQLEEWLQEDAPTWYLPVFGGFFLPAVICVVRKKKLEIQAELCFSPIPLPLVYRDLELCHSLLPGIINIKNNSSWHKG